ncbi:restriction endonuclease [Bacillus atrophaeus]|uniref:restriction endonuclease n=1 Tax=Bacillus atrophaeus TaxID=1452 RepID=UPI001F0A49E3|nr:restriction endonuclease [Bacillus atrophaeus]
MVFDLSEDYFDSYYFEELKQLNRDIAETNIKKVKIIHDAYNKKIKEAKENKKKVQHPNIASIQEIQNEYRGLFKKTDRNGKLITSQDRGYHLENLIMKIAKRENLQVTRPFKIKGEQIDGDLKFEGEHYLVEAKWHDKQTASNDLYQFAYKTEGKLYGRGLFISINGFSTESVEALTIGKAVRTILIDGTDFMHVVEDRISFSELLDHKIKAAQTAGLIYYDAVMQKSKIQ